MSNFLIVTGVIFLMIVGIGILVPVLTLSVQFWVSWIYNLRKAVRGDDKQIHPPVGSGP